MFGRSAKPPLWRRSVQFLSCVTLALCALSQPAGATADGPDHFRVEGVSKGGSLTIRAEPFRTAEPIGAIPHDGRYLRNLGCIGGLSLTAYQSATEEQRRQARFTRWCRVDYGGTNGWVAGWYLAEDSTPPTPPAQQPSFDCARVSSSAEKAVCADPGLAELDRELDRLFRLALNGPSLTAERRQILQATQRGWIKVRNGCRKEGNALTACIQAEYAGRIHHIRAGYADARSDDAAGISLGPVVYRCIGLDAPVSAVFLNGERSLASLLWKEHRMTLSQAISASGARYALDEQTASLGPRYTLPESGGGAVEFWIKGDDARFTLPGREGMNCAVEPTG